MILAIIAAALVSVVGSSFTAGGLQHEITYWGDFSDAGFWLVFAIFFPAATGIMAGANMSADLANPRRSIPLGTMVAIGISLVVYMGLAWWLARSASTEELLSNYTVMIDKALWGPAVVGGLLGATFSSGLASLVGAPRILEALGEHRIFPMGEWFSTRSASGEPRNAIFVTGGIVLLGLLLRDLNAIAPLITMFFLITYGMINVVVLVEQSLDMVSFRPIFRIPRWVPLIGTVGSLGAMFIVNAVFGLVATIIVTAVYLYLTGHRPDHQLASVDDIRSGLFVALAEWAAKQVTQLPTANERAWKPNLLVPVEDTRELRGTFNLLRNLLVPRGSIHLVGVASRHPADELGRRLPLLVRSFRDEGVFTRWTLVEAEEYKSGVISSLQGLSGTFFRPNIVFLKLDGDGQREEDVTGIVAHARRLKMGVLLFADDPIARLGRQKDINVWITDQSPDWSLHMDLGNVDLALLSAYKLQQNWHGRVRVISAVREEAHLEDARRFLRRLLELSRLVDMEMLVEHGTFEEVLKRAPQSDVDFFGLQAAPDFAFMRRMVEVTRSACVFVADSGQESILA